MIGFMPRLYEGELLYSWFARYKRYSLNRKRNTSRELFGRQHYQIHIDLPGNLAFLQSKISMFGYHSPEELLEKHTFYRYYYAFINDKFLKHHGKQMMIQSTYIIRGSLDPLLRLRRETVSKGKFHFCPACVIEDLDTIGETYWRVLHQIHGVFVCSKHNVFLCDSKMPFSSEDYEAARGEELRRHEIVKVDIDSDLHQKLLWIAMEIDRILRGEVFISPYTLSFSHHVNRKSHQLKYDEGIFDKLWDFYGVPFLTMLTLRGTEIERMQWLCTILENKSISPIDHILLKNYLEHHIPETEN